MNPYKFGLMQLAAMLLAPLAMAEDSASSILDATLDDMPDLPGFKQPPTGAYAVIVESILEKKVGDKKAVEAKFKIIEVMEVTETNVPDDELMVADDEFACLYMLDNETGIGFLKDFLRPLSEVLGTKNNREIIAGAKGMALILVVKRTWDKEKERYFVNIKKITIA